MSVLQKNVLGEAVKIANFTKFSHLSTQFFFLMSLLEYNCFGVVLVSAV